MKKKNLSQQAEEANLTITKKVVQGGVWIYGRMIATNVLNLGVMAILARKLTPADFGLVAIAQVVIRFLLFLSSEGVGQYVIYDNEPGREERVHAAFWMDLFLSLTSMVFGLFAIPIISKFFNEPGLGAILTLLLIKFPISSISKIPDSLLKKRLEFKKLEIRDSILEVISSLTSVIMAISGYGVWSIVIPGLIIAPIRAISVFFLAGWWPRFSLYIRYWPRIFSYSANIMGGTILFNIISEGDTLLIGKLLGVQILGVYNLAWQSANMVGRIIVSSVNKLTLPTLSSIADDLGKIQRALVRILRLLSIVSFPALIGLFIVADEFILVIYGEQWRMAILPMRILIIYALRYSIGSPTGSVYRVIGRPDIVFKFLLALTPFYITAILIGSRYGIVGIAVGITIVRTGFGVIDFFIVSKCLKIGIQRLLKPVIPVLVASLWMGAIVLIFKILFDIFLSLGQIFQLIILVVIGIFAYVVLIRTKYRELIPDIVQISKPMMGSYHLVVDKILNIPICEQETT